MKATLFIVMMLILVIPASADVELTDPGIMPDNFFYPFDVFFDKVRVALTFNEEAKINKQFEVAEERLSEAQAMMQINKTEESQEALENHNALMEQVRARINTTDGVNETLKFQLQIEERLRVHEGKIVGVASDLEPEDQDVMAGVLSQVGSIEDEVQQSKSQTMPEIDNFEIVECEFKKELGFNCDGDVPSIK